MGLNPFKASAESHERRVEQGVGTEGDADAILNKAIGGGVLTDAERRTLDAHYPEVLLEDDGTEGPSSKIIAPTQH